MKNLTGPLTGFLLEHNSVVIDITHGLIHFPHLTIQVESAASGTSAKPKSVLTGDALTKLPMTRKTITALVDHPSDWIATDTVTPLEQFKEMPSLLISHSKSTIFDKKVAVRLTSTTESAN